MSKTTQWRKVTEGTPPENTTILVVEDGKVCICYIYDLKNYREGIQKWLEVNKISHWMPLPEPPGGENAKN